ncbi:hypothetical protein PFICI_13572 [Pestalotiopsis fici W106-1]|uniref:RRM domain-containing protein n=1 Tax=Pestalotiopsis fici (strain W106-1 / CGMCC3.15140) TaxID=1229662 RepID=W3WMJ4_PESFW|nr:uncharacterized protein PFICI_13572 [Pestalotiopsis fici W106-1]ETS75088.1 hypothetical protein PFICI_13572 [Pestalotiopsis fici W106-1]
MHTHVVFEDVDDWKARMLMELSIGRLIHVSGFPPISSRAEIEGYLRGNGVMQCKFIWPHADANNHQHTSWFWLHFEHTTQTTAALRALDGGVFGRNTILAFMPDGMTLYWQFTAAARAMPRTTARRPQPELGIWSEESRAAILKLLEDFPPFWSTNR